MRAVRPEVITIFRMDDTLTSLKNLLTSIAELRRDADAIHVRLSRIMTLLESDSRRPFPPRITKNPGAGLRTGEFWTDYEKTTKVSPTYGDWTPPREPLHWHRCHRWWADFPPIDFRIEKASGPT